MLLLHWSEMRTFLNVPLLDMNRTYQMFAHHNFVLPYPLMTMCSCCEQVADTVQVLETILSKNELIQTYQIFFMNFWYIEHYAASFRDVFYAKMN